MPRSMLRDPIAETSRRIFGKKAQPVNLTEVARKTGINKSTLSRRRKDPREMRLQELALIVKATGRSDAEIVEIVRGII